MTGVPDPVRALADNAISARWTWSADDRYFHVAAGNVEQNAWEKLAALAPDLARVAADLHDALRSWCEQPGMEYADLVEDSDRAALAAYEQLQARAGDAT